MDYNNGKKYQLLINVNDEVDVGSTTQPLCTKTSQTQKRHQTSRLQNS